MKSGWESGAVTAVFVLNFVSIGKEVRLFK